MTLQNFFRLLQARWLTIFATATVVLLVTVAVTLLTTPRFQASTRLFVSTGGGSSLADIYQGSLLSQARVLSYSELLSGDNLAQRTINKLGLDMTAEELQDEITVRAKRGTVLIDVDVLDPSPVRARDIANTLSDEFVVMVGELETPATGGAPEARVVVEQRASVPDAPEIPKPMRNVALGLAAGLVLGILAAFLRDRLDNTIKDGGSLQKLAGAGQAGSIPYDKDLLVDPAISFDSDHSGIAEAFRKLRTNLQFLSVDNPPRVMLITSALPKEGKSETAINLALVLAEAGNDVVLVDGDLRRPSLARYLDLVDTVGLSTVLSGRVSLEDALQETRFPRLHVLTSGAIPPNPSELLGSLAAQKALGDLRTRFDYVIVDSPPLLAVTDAAVLASGSDGVLAIARFGQTRVDQFEHAIKNLEDVGATLLGTVLTMVPIRGVPSYSYSGYYGEDESRVSSKPRGVWQRFSGNRMFRRTVEQ